MGPEVRERDCEIQLVVVLDLELLTMMTTIKKERNIKMKARAENIHMNLMSPYSSEEILSPDRVKSLNSLLSSEVIKYLK